VKSFPRAATLALLLSIVALNLAFRYPTTDHEVGADSFVFHGLSQAIIDSKYAAWLINPLSLFGLYPLSHPSGSLLVRLRSEGSRSKARSSSSTSSRPSWALWELS